MSDLHQVLRDLEAQRQAALERYDHAIAGVRQLVEANGNGRAPRAPTTHRVASPSAAPGKGRGRRPTRDWNRARQLYDQGKGFQEIAAALGTSVGTIYDARSRFHWPKRSAGKKNGVKGKGAGA